jgi:hypothetical protein
MMGEFMKTLTIIISVLIMLAAGQALARDLSPMMAEIEAAMEATRMEVADLKLQYETAVSDEQAMEIMREVARVKREGRVELMRIQLRHARLAGNDGLVLQLEEVIARMTAPPVKGTPVPRPIPQH